MSQTPKTENAPAAAEAPQLVISTLEKPETIKLESSSAEQQTPPLLECSKLKPTVLTADLKNEHLADEITARPRSALDFHEVSGLVRQSGKSPEDWLIFAATQLVENALDKPNTRNIEVRRYRDAVAQYFLVKDDGQPEFTLQSAGKVADCVQAPSSKRAVYSSVPSRGALGNGLPTSLHMTGQLWEEDEKPEYTAEIWNSNEKFLIKIDEKGDSAHPAKLDDDVDRSYTTCILLKFPLSFSFNDPRGIFEATARLNQDVSFCYYEDEQLKFLNAANFPRRLLKKRDFGNPWCYDWNEYQALCKEKAKMPQGEFLTRFHKCGRAKAKKIKVAAGTEKIALVGDIPIKKLRRLFDVQRKMTGALKATSLPSLGPERMLAFVDRHQAENANYVVLRGNYEDEDRNKKFPFVLEILAYPERAEKIVECINGSVSTQTPFSGPCYYFNDGKRIDLHDFIRDKAKSLLIHLSCSNVEWHNAAKGQLSVKPFRDILFKAVKQAVKNKAVASVSEQVLIAWSKKVMDRYPKLDFTVRQIFYRLVSLHNYTNNRAMYNRLGKALVAGRESGAIDPERIVDFSRPEYINNLPYRKPQEYIEKKLQEFVEEFDLDRWDTQAVFVEVWIEKEALARVLLPICKKYRVNLIVGRGYNSWTQIYKAVNTRFPTDGRKMVVLYMGDHDPPGLHIQDKLKEKLRWQAAKKKLSLDLKVLRVALSYAQIIEYGLPPSSLKKKPGAKYKEYIEKFGPYVWELDALDPEILQELLENAIKSLIEPISWALKREDVAWYREQMQPQVEAFRQSLLSTFSSGFGVADDDG